jgi:hypothetical protein
VSLQHTGGSRLVYRGVVTETNGAAELQTGPFGAHETHSAVRSGSGLGYGAVVGSVTLPMNKMVSAPRSRIR